MNETISLQINKCKTFIDFMLSQQQWSGLQKSDVESWLKNFKDVQPEERLLVYKLLSNIIYFSEADVITALKEGIYKCLYYGVILEKQINAKFSMSQQALAAVCQEELENTYFIPLLDSNSPHESGNYIMRLLVQQNIIQPRQSVFLESLPDNFISRKIKRLVVVDDCVGSGHQLLDFWTSATVDINDNVITLAELCEKYGVEANYLTLFGYDKSIDMLQGLLRNLHITPDERAVLAPLGTRPHSMACALFACKHPHTRIIYDYAVECQRRAIGIAEIKVYHLTMFLEV